MAIFRIEICESCRLITKDTEELKEHALKEHTKPRFECA
jgi:hypothetical protein